LPRAMTDFAGLLLLLVEVFGWDVLTPPKEP
jgi:hypothetical protein